MPHWIQNYSQLATTPERKLVLDVIEAGFDSIDTERIIITSVRLDGNLLTIRDQQFDLALFDRVLVLGFGKASAKAALALERVLGNQITDGIVIAKNTAPTAIIKCFEGTHPLPSLHNVTVAEMMEKLVKDVTAKDLVINLVSGGGSALLCWTREECEQGIRLYNEYLKSGDDIKGLNTVRKHISKVKGGGLAKILYPATVVSLIFSDVAGNNYHMVDSGPTYKDNSTVEDAKRIIEKYNLGDYSLQETPKDDKYFEKVYNIPVMSNVLALQAMEAKAKSLGLVAKIISDEMFDTPENTIQLMLSNAKPGTLLLGGSEIKMVVDKHGGKGGRNSYLPLQALSYIGDSDTFASIASDGLDNSDSAGALADSLIKLRAGTQHISTEDFLERFDSYTFFEKLNDGLIYTGPTEANISDLLVWYRK